MLDVQIIVLKLNFLKIVTFVLKSNYFKVTLDIFAHNIATKRYCNEKINLSHGLVTSRFYELKLVGIEACCSKLYFYYNIAIYL
jgi:hypothetical protein